MTLETIQKDGKNWGTTDLISSKKSQLKKLTIIKTERKHTRNGSPPSRTVLDRS